MTVGFQASVAGLNTQLGSCAVALRQASSDIGGLWEYIISLGANQAAQEAALVTLGFSSGDATTFWTMANYLFAVSELYYGQITQATTFDYDSATAVIRGGN